MAGRGAWPGDGSGGTLDYSADTGGPYYKVPISSVTPKVGTVTNTADINQRAVNWAVKYYQRALNRRMGSNLTQDGIFGNVTKGIVVNFQNKVKITADGVIGQTTSRMLVCPDLQRVVNGERNKYPSLYFITPQIVCGTVKHESRFDAGAVGSVDDNDHGIGQINTIAHPQYTEAQRFDPDVAFLFIFNYYKTSIADSRINTVDDMIASYNLGVAGAARWISQGRPEIYYPSPTSSPRRVWDYIDSIKTGCSLPPR